MKNRNLTIGDLEYQYDGYCRLVDGLQDLVVKTCAGDGFYCSDPVELIGDLAIKIEELDHFRATVIGMWATDKPDLIPENIKALFCEIK